MNAILQTVDLVKQFPTVRANDRVSIALREGEIIGILGENGAGKTTLMNMLYGLFRPTSGTISIDGQEVEFTSPRDAIAAGLGMVHQHFMLVETLTVTENIILGAEPQRAQIIDYKQARRDVVALSRQYGFHIDPDELIVKLSVGQQQRVEILKALYRKARILILDEPTAVLTPQEVEEFFNIVSRLAEERTAVIIITHKLDEIKKITNRVYVMRLGKVIGERATKHVSKKELARMMVGREIHLGERMRRPQPTLGASRPPLLEARSITTLNDRNLVAVDEISFAVNDGEIVGIAGVDGNGQTELAEMLVGLRKITRGTLIYRGEDISASSTYERIGKKIGYVPADRQKYGLALSMYVRENMILGTHRLPPFARHSILQREPVVRHADDLARRFDVRPTNTDTIVSHLSGGNQQKVILAREFSRDPALLIISQPTRGLDVGAIEYIHAQIMRMRNEGVGIVLFSLELDEIFALADRILVMYNGRVTHEDKPDNTTPHTIGAYMMGAHEQ